MIEDTQPSDRELNTPPVLAMRGNAMKQFTMPQTPHKSTKKHVIQESASQVDDIVMTLEDKYSQNDRKVTLAGTNAKAELAITRSSAQSSNEPSAPQWSDTHTHYHHCTATSALNNTASATSALQHAASVADMPPVGTSELQEVLLTNLTSSI